MKRSIVLPMVLLLCASAWAQTEKPPMDLSIYPGGSSTMEINMTAEELMQMLQAMLPMMGDKLGKLGEAISLDDIADVLQDVKRIQYLQVDVAQTGVTDKQIADFYSKHLPPGKWSRVLWMLNGTSGTSALYSQDNTEQIYAFRVTSVKAEEKMIKRVTVLKIEGRIDYVKALKLAAKLGITFSQPRGGK